MKPGDRVQEAGSTFLGHLNADRPARHGVLLAVVGPMARVHWDGTLIDTSTPAGRPEEWVNADGDWLVPEESSVS